MRSSAMRASSASCAGTLIWFTTLPSARFSSVHARCCGSMRCMVEHMHTVGSTEFILNTITNAPPNTHWLVGTELNLVNRLAEEVKHEGKIVQFMAPTVCMCSTMQRIDPQHLAWTLENLADGKVVNRISVPEHEAALAKVALERMLAVS